jgi:hypothetical protein
MCDLSFSELTGLHLETIQKHAAAACLLRHCHLPKLSLFARARQNLGELLIQTGQRLKEAPRHLEAEPASLSSLTIIL